MRVNLYNGHYQQITIKGKVGWIEELRDTSKTAVIRFSVGCNILKSIEWFTFVAFGEKAKLIAGMAQKGSGIIVTAVQQTSSWEDKVGKIIIQKDMVVDKFGFDSNMRSKDDGETISSFDMSEEELDLIEKYSISTLESKGYTVIKHIYTDNLLDQVITKSKG